MSLIVTSLLVASGVLLGRYLARGGQKKEEEPQREGAREEPAKKKEEDPFEGFACKLGDVIMRSSTEEAWLAGAIVLSEQAPIAALFVAPEAKQDRAVLAWPAPRAELLWLAPVPASELGLVGKEPPASLEHQGDRFERTRRLPLRARRVGSGAPDVGEVVILAEYGSLTGDRVIVLAGATLAAFRGVSLDAGTYTILPSAGDPD